MEEKDLFETTEIHSMEEAVAEEAVVIKLVEIKKIYMIPTSNGSILELYGKTDTGGYTFISGLTFYTSDMSFKVNKNQIQYVKD